MYFYGFEPPRTLDGAYLVETHRGEEFSEYWMKLADGQVVGYAEIQRPQRLLCSVQVRGEGCGIGHHLLELLKSELGGPLTATGCATAAGQAFLIREGVAPAEGWHIVQPMRFVHDWDSMWSRSSHQLHSDIRPQDAIPEQFSNSDDLWAQVMNSEIVIPSQHLACGDILEECFVQDVSKSDESVRVRVGDGTVKELPIDTPVTIRLAF